MIDITDEDAVDGAPQEVKLLNTVKTEILFEEKKESSDEKRSLDRRQHDAGRDERGFINEPAYHGIDRRSGHDRRLPADIKQQELIRKDRIKFFLRSCAYTTFFTGLFVGVFFLLFAPECIKIREFLKTTDLKKITQEIVPGEEFYLEGYLNRKIEKIENYFEGVTSAARGDEDNDNKQNSMDLAKISAVLKKMGELQNGTDAEKTNSRKSISNLKNILLNASQSNPSDLAGIISAATDYDVVLRTLLEPVKDKNVAAAAILIVLNEFRDNVYSGNSYESDLRVIKRLAGDDPELTEALNKLAPYAANGIISKDTLTKEFKQLTQEIVLAKIQGEDAEIKERAMARFDQLVEEAKNKKLTGNDEASVVARAQVMLEQGDVQGAVTTLSKLEGNSAKSASSWIETATGSAAAADSSEYIIKELIENVAGGSSFSPDQLFKEIFRDNSPVYISPALKH